MTKQEFITAILTEGRYKEINVMKRLFSLPTNSKFTTIKDGKVYYKDNLLEFAELDKAIVKTNDVYLIDDKKTTVGRAITNKLLFDATNGKLEYINKPFKLSYPESIIRAGLGKEFTLGEFKAFCKVSAYIRMLTPYIVVPVTMKTISPIPNIDKVKARIANELSKLSPDWKKDDTLVLRFDAEVMNFVKEYYKDDPTYGITFVGKTVGSIKKQFVSVGINSTPDPHGKAKTIVTSLNDGLQLDAEDIAATNNSVRAGSAGRGIDTRDGGVTFKTVVQAAHYIKIKNVDCKTKRRFKIVVSNHNQEGLEGCYMDDNVELTKGLLQSLLGKTINIRYPAYCELKGANRCKYCCGNELSLSPNGITLMAIKTGSLGVLNALAKFHQSTEKLTKITPAMIFA